MTSRIRILLSCALTLPLLGWGVASAAPAVGKAAKSLPVVAPEHVLFESLGSNANAVDSLVLICPTGTHHAHFDIHDASSGGPTLGIVGTDYETGKATIRRAPQGGFSTVAQLNNGPGEYDLFVFKAGGSTGVAANYDTKQTCHNSNHVDVGGSHFIFQDQ
jgi:hypothetical protein